MPPRSLLVIPPDHPHSPAPQADYKPHLPSQLTPQQPDVLPFDLEVNDSGDLGDPSLTPLTLEK